MSTAVITFSPEGLKVMQQIATGMEVDQFLHQDISAPAGVNSFERVYALTEEIFNRYSGLVYIAPCGVVVRAIAPLIRHKLKDPAVICLDVGARHAVSLLSGHEGGANDLTVAVANLTGAEPVISTTTEAVKDLIIGIGCRKGKSADEISSAITSALEMAESVLIACATWQRPMSKRKNRVYYKRQLSWEFRCASSMQSRYALAISLLGSPHLFKRKSIFLRCLNPQRYFPEGEHH